MLTLTNQAEEQEEEEVQASKSEMRMLKQRTCALSSPAHLKPALT